MNPLDRLHDIVLTEPASWTPQTAGWWGLLALLVLVALRSGLRMRRRFLENRYRRLALVELDRIERGAKSPDALDALPALVKKTALAGWPRREVAALSGDSWLRFLDESYGGTGFTEGPGRTLPELAYGSSGELDEEDASALTALVREWIRRHRVRV